jgi:hypothetical protein
MAGFPRRPNPAPPRILENGAVFIIGATLLVEQHVPPAFKLTMALGCRRMDVNLHPGFNNERPRRSASAKTSQRSSAARLSPRL